MPEPAHDAPPLRGAEGSDAVLPTGDERRLHPWSWLFVLLQQLRQFIVPLAALLFLNRGGDRWQLLPLAGVGVLALVSVWQYITYRYAVRGDSLVVRSGLFERQLRQIPFARIHNVAVHQTLLHRLFGVAEVRLESAGGDKPEAQMRVLRFDEAMALERLIRHRGQQPADAAGDGSARTATAVEGTVLLVLPTAEVLRLGLISNRGMVVVAGAFAVAWQLLPNRAIGTTPDRAIGALVADTGRALFGYASRYEASLAAKGAAALLLVLLALALVRALSVVLALVQYHGFRLLAQGRRLTIERGLLTRLRTSASRRRIQAWTLREGLLHRLLRRRSLSVDTAVSEKPDDQRALRELAPVATPAACDALVRRLLPGVAWPPAQWRGLHARAWWRLWLGDALFGLVVASVATWRFGPWGLLLLAWLPLSALVARQHAQRAGYAVDDALLAVREGWWSRHWRFAEIDTLQALQLRQSPLDRRCGMASLWCDTAGAGAMSVPLRIRHLPQAQAQALYARLSRQLRDRPLRW